MFSLQEIDEENVTVTLDVSKKALAMLATQLNMVDTWALEERAIFTDDRSYQEFAELVEFLRTIRDL
jgi:hypothetical protein